MRSPRGVGDGISEERIQRSCAAIRQLWSKTWSTPWSRVSKSRLGRRPFCRRRGATGKVAAAAPPWLEDYR